MPTFDTPEPISATISVNAGRIRLLASDRADTVVDVRPSDPDRKLDVELTRDTTVDLFGARLNIKTHVRPVDFFRRSGLVDVTVELPTGSQVEATTAAGDIVSTGALGECRLRTSAGHLDLGTLGPAKATTAAGNVTVAALHGDSQLGTSSGTIRIGTLEGTAGVKSSAGDLHVGELVGGSVELRTSMGSIDLGIAEGTAAWLDVHTGFGVVRNGLDEGAPTEQPAATAEVRAKTSHGDIVIHRSRP